MHACPACSMSVSIPKDATAILCRCCLTILRVEGQRLREMTVREQNALAHAERDLEVRGERRFRPGRAA